MLTANCQFSKIKYASNRAILSDLAATKLQTIIIFTIALEKNEKVGTI